MDYFKPFPVFNGQAKFNSQIAKDINVIMLKLRLKLDSLESMEYFHKINQMSEENQLKTRNTLIKIEGALNDILNAADGFKAGPTTTTTVPAGLDSIF